MARTRLRGLEIGGIQIGIEVPESCEWEWPAGVVADYACLPRNPEVHVGVRIGETGRPDLGGEQYAIGAWTFEVARRGEDWVLGLSRAGMREQLATFDKNFTAGEIVLSREPSRGPRFPLRSPLDEWIVLHRTVARGGLCLNGHATIDQDGALVRLGHCDPSMARGWTTPSTTLLGRNTLWVREEEGRLCVFRTPWGDAMDVRLGGVARVSEFRFVEESDAPYREVLDPGDAAELLVTHSVVPVCDEGLLERVLGNARKMGERSRVIRMGEPRARSAPMAWQSPELQSGFAPPRGAS